MQKEKNNQLFVYYLITAIIFLCLKVFYTAADTDDLLFLLRPVTKLIEFGTGTTSVYEPGAGYFFERLHIIVNKSCSGFNFGCLCFLVICFSAFRHIAKRNHRLLVFPVAILCSYVATLFVNTSRIWLAIFMNGYFTLAGKQSPEWLHLAEGAFVYLFFLVCIYLFTEFILSKTTSKNEKSA